LKTEDNVPLGKLLEKKYNKKIIFWHPNLKSLKKGVGSGAVPDLLVRGTDPGIRIRILTKMSQIPNTEKNK
jgi:hypothetical protein